MDTASRHLLCEYYGCDGELLDDKERVAQILERAVSAAGATVVASAFHVLEPQGISGVVLLEESHFSIHTWPEYGYATADLFTCGCCDPELGHQLLLNELEAERAEIMIVKRGSRSATAPGMELSRHFTERPGQPRRAVETAPAAWRR